MTSSYMSHLKSNAGKINFLLITTHIVVVVLIVGIIWLGYRSPADASGLQSNNSILDPSKLNVDQVVAANVATSAALITALPVYSNVSNLSVSLNAKNQMDQTDDMMLNKPQIIDQFGRDSITNYTVQNGDTVQSLASKFKITANTIRWANNMAADNLTAGQILKILGTTGITYTVRPGDSAAALASKYKTDQNLIISFNNLELSGLNAGQQIIIPNGVLPENEKPGYIAPQSTNTYYSPFDTHVAYFGGNGYAVGYCTFYVYNARAALGHPIPGNWGNATSWAYFARLDGYRVDKNPEVGAIMQTGGGWGGYTYFGHVAIVRSVNGDGSVTIEEMNATKGWNNADTRIISASDASLYNYIH